MRAGVYVGTIEHLAGKRALLRDTVDGTVLAQFDDLTLTPYCYGWHPFPEGDFKTDTAGRPWFGNRQWFGEGRRP